jgi:flagellar basal body P-ring formation protein FlgA
MSVKQYMLMGFLFGTCSFLHANAMQSSEVLKLKIEAFVFNAMKAFEESKITVTLTKADSPLHLKACPEEKLVVFNPYKTPISNTSTLGIQCTEENTHWTLYMPIQIHVLKTVYALKRPVQKGESIQEDALFAIEKEIDQLKQGYYTEPSEVLGRISLSSLQAGSILSPQNTQLPKLVKKNQQVSILAGNTAFTVSMTGVALSDGAMGETVSVRNLSSKQIVEGRVCGEQKVHV